MTNKLLTKDALPTRPDRDTIKQVKARFLQLNSERIISARALLTDRQCQHFDLLPFLFHTNHPKFPGYLSGNTPAGISNYQPNNDDIKRAKLMSRGFRFEERVRGSRNLPILALFVMGSVGSVAQSASSDMDFWLCYNPLLNPEQQQSLQKKANAIAHWAKNVGLDWHFFLMDADAFYRGEHGDLSGEDSGSAQHFLLLDEFYRSAILLAGRMPLWWFITPTKKFDYAFQKQDLQTRGFLRDHEWIDFGPVGEVPTEEFVSAAVWQLYKSIRSPFKSLLKLLLLEVYLAQQKSLFTLADQLKLAVYTGSYSAYKLDPYIALLTALSLHLEASREYERLELMRQCFYIKLNRTSKDIFNAKIANQRLAELIKAWQWPDSEFQNLDQIRQWSAQKVINKRRSLVDELTNSYRLLLDLARSSNKAIQVNNADITILGRKLHVAFERSAGKIELINPNISDEIFCKNLVFEATPAGTEQHWQVFLANSRWTKARAPLQQSRSLIKLLLWCYCNKIVTSNSRTRIDGDEDCKLNILRLLRAVDDLQLKPVANVPHRQFIQPPTITRLLLLVNDNSLSAERDQRQSLADAVAQLERDAQSLNTDPLNSAGLNLAYNFSAVTQSSWGEIKYQFFAASFADCITALMPLVTPETKIDVISIDTLKPTLIENRLANLFAQFQRLKVVRNEPQSSTATRLLLQVGSGFLLCNSYDWSVQNCSSIAQLQTALAEPLPEPCNLLIDADSARLLPSELSWLNALCQQKHDAAISVYFRVKRSSADIYLRDERGSLVCFQLNFFNQQALLRPLHHFIRATLQRNPLATAQSMFGIYPVKFFELCAHPSGVQAHPRQASSDIRQLRLLQIHVSIEQLTRLNQPASWLFRAWLDGDPVATTADENSFAKLAKAILTKRSNGERYPCFITDLDISGCQQQLVKAGELQTSHFVQLKVKFERALNLALQNAK